MQLRIIDHQCNPLRRSSQQRCRMMDQLCPKCMCQLANPLQKISPGSHHSQRHWSRYQHAQGYSKRLLKFSWNQVSTWGHPILSRFSQQKLPHWAKGCLVQSPAGDNRLDAGAGAKESAHLPGAGIPNSAANYLPPVPASVLRCLNASLVCTAPIALQIIWANLS